MRLFKKGKSQRKALALFAICSPFYQTTRVIGAKRKKHLDAQHKKHYALSYV